MVKTNRLAMKNPILVLSIPNIILFIIKLVCLPKKNLLKMYSLYMMSIVCLIIFVKKIFLRRWIRRDDSF